MGPDSTIGFFCVVKLAETYTVTDEKPLTTPRPPSIRLRVLDRVVSDTIDTKLSILSVVGSARLFLDFAEP